jgi:hypothetical protein
MDPMTICSLVGNIIQFLEFGRGLCRDFLEILRDSEGLSEKCKDTKLLAESFKTTLSTLPHDLGIFQENLSREPGNRSNGNSKIKEIAHECEKIAFDLVKKVESSGVNKAGAESRKWNSFVAAVKKNLWSQKELISLKERLDEYRKELDWHVLMSIRYF